MFEEPLQVLKILKRFDELLEVLKPPRCFGGFVVLDRKSVV
jgi:hypothetical protein